MSGVFISYSHKNSEELARLRVHLKPLERIAEVEVFSDTDIKTDEAWRERIRAQIADCSIAILLVSADFLASDFINDHELPHLFEGRRRQRKTIITVFVSPCVVELFPEIAEYQGFNTPDRPLTAMSENEVEQTYARLASEIKALLPSGPASDQTIKTTATDRPEIDYSNLGGQRLFSNATVKLPNLIAALPYPDLSGFSFHNCDLIGPSVLYCPYASIQDCHLDAPEGRAENLLLKPVGSYVVGVMPAAHLAMVNCNISNISFIDEKGQMQGAFEKSGN